MVKAKNIFSGCLLCLSLAFQAAVAQQQDTLRGLKDYYRKYFPIGVAINVGNLHDAMDSALICREFNSITPENSMKMALIHPAEDVYNWGNADAIVNFAVSHHIRIRGHNLCWHNQAPKWLFYTRDGKLVSKEVLLERLKKHIYTVVGRYKGKIYAWDVVNEAVSDDSTQFLRNSLWYKICGEDFIFKAFQYAHEADPKAILFYNDYNTEILSKRERIYRLLRDMKAANIPVDGIGLQAHWTIYFPSRENIITSIQRFSGLGLKVQITELDVSVYHDKTDRRNQNNVEYSNLSPSLEKLQQHRYQMFFEVFRQFREEITGITFWNVSDKSSWLNDFPVKSRKDYPLLFDRDDKRKEAYKAVIDF